MSILRPFRGWRPVPDKAAKVASPPYDVLNSEEARQMAKGNPLSFLHVVKSEIDLDPNINIYSEKVYATAAKNLKRLIVEGVLVRDPKPYLYLYEQRMRIGEKEHVQICVVGACSIDEYQNNLIKKHELTRADKEKDRTVHIDTLNANTGLVFLTYKQDQTIDNLVADSCKLQPVYDFVAADGIGHRFWVVSDDVRIKAFVEAFAKISHLYIADGHHRSASSSAVREIRKAANPKHTGNEEYNFFLMGAFSHDQLNILDYNRVVMDLNGLDEDMFLEKIQEKFHVSKVTSPKPERPTEFGMYLKGSWYRLTAKSGTFDHSDPVQSLDASILQNNLLSPVLGIADPRKDKRIDFVGGIRGTKELERRVAQGAAVAFSMYPTSIDQLMTIADAGKIMPPKSTWFEPKLRSGLVVRTLD